MVNYLFYDCFKLMSRPIGELTGVAGVKPPYN